MRTPIDATIARLKWRVVLAKRHLAKRLAKRLLTFGVSRHIVPAVLILNHTEPVTSS